MNSTNLTINKKKSEGSTAELPGKTHNTPVDVPYLDKGGAVGVTDRSTEVLVMLR